MDLYYAAACQVDQSNPVHRNDMHHNTTRMLAMLERAVTSYRPFYNIRLIVYPEFAHAAPIYETTGELIERLGIGIPNEHTDRIEKAARKYNIFVQTGSFLEVDPRWPNAIFNTTCLIGPNGILARYRKVNPWIPWELSCSPHDIKGYPDEPFPVTRTEIGNLGVATCYDWLFPEVTRELVLGGAEILIRISAYMDPWGGSPSTDWWTIVNRCRALENMCFVVAANQGATTSHYPPFSWPGSSMIVDYDGRILAETSPGPGERIVVGPINLTALRQERRYRLGHSMPAHLRTEIYKRQRASVFSSSASEGDNSYDRLAESIRESQGGLSYNPFLRPNRLV